MNNTWSDLRVAIESLYKSLGTTIITIIGGIAILLGIWIGLQFIMAAGDEQKLKIAKKHLTNVIIGVAVIFIIGALLPILIGILQTWFSNTGEA